AVEEALEQLSDRERRVVRLRFGLDDGQLHTLEEVGKEFGVTRERIRQIDSKTLAKLRHPTRSQRLRDYLDEGSSAGSQRRQQGAFLELEVLLQGDDRAVLRGRLEGHPVGEEPHQDDAAAVVPVKHRPS